MKVRLEFGLPIGGTRLMPTAGCRRTATRSLPHHICGICVICGLTHLCKTDRVAAGALRSRSPRRCQ